MANYPADLKYTKDHEWARLEGDLVRIGITQYAVEQLGDITLVDLPKAGTQLERDRALRRHRVGQGGERAVRADQRRGRRGQRRARGQARARQRSALRRGLDAADQARATPRSSTSLLDAAAYERHLGSLG